MRAIRCKARRVQKRAEARNPGKGADLQAQNMHGETPKADRRKRQKGPEEHQEGAQTADHQAEEKRQPAKPRARVNRGDKLNHIHQGEKSKEQRKNAQELAGGCGVGPGPRRTADVAGPEWQWRWGAASRKTRECSTPDACKEARNPGARCGRDNRVPKPRAGIVEDGRTPCTVLRIRPNQDGLGEKEKPDGRASAQLLKQ